MDGVLDRANPPAPADAALVYLKVSGSEPLPVRRATALSFITIKNMLDDTADHGTTEPLGITEDLAWPLVVRLIGLAEALGDPTLPPARRVHPQLEALPPPEFAALMKVVVFPRRASARSSACGRRARGAAWRRTRRRCSRARGTPRRGGP